MPTIVSSEIEVSIINQVNSSVITCFTETPRKLGGEMPVPRIDAFGLFSLFTADIIRSKTVFTR